jgi:hypothetical protein
MALFTSQPSSQLVFEGVLATGAIADGVSVLTFAVPGVYPDFLYVVSIEDIDPDVLVGTAWGSDLDELSVQVFNSSGGPIVSDDVTVRVIAV